MHICDTTHSTHIFHSYISFKTYGFDTEREHSVEKAEKVMEVQHYMYITNCDDYKLHKKGKKVYVRFFFLYMI